MSTDHLKVSDSSPAGQTLYAVKITVQNRSFNTSVLNTTLPFLRLQLCRRDDKVTITGNEKTAHMTFKITFHKS